MTGQGPHHAPPWELCPNPRTWGHLDGGQGCELELLPFLEGLVRLLKPKTILETGTGSGQSATYLARGCDMNGFGHVFTYEIDKGVAEGAREYIRRYHQEARVTIFDFDLWGADWNFGPIDLMFCDGGIPRYKEVLRYRPWMTMQGIVVCHDAVSPEHEWYHLQPYYQRILLPTPCGVWMMQRKEAAWFGDRPPVEGLIT